VTTGFYNNDSGKYLNPIRGPGDVTAPVPEPETYLMLFAGPAAVGFMVRRRTFDRAISCLALEGPRHETHRRLRAPFYFFDADFGNRSQLLAPPDPGGQDM